LGYLWCVPEGAEESRASVMGMELPELPTKETLQDVWHSLGMALSGMSGAIPLSWQELRAFADLAGCDIKPFEALCLIEMSRAYCVEVAERDPLRISPMERQK
jgi:hypothetical protein